MLFFEWNRTCSCSETFFTTPLFNVYSLCISTPSALFCVIYSVSFYFKALFLLLLFNYYLNNNNYLIFCVVFMSGWELWGRWRPTRTRRPHPKEEGLKTHLTGEPHCANLMTWLSKTDSMDALVADVCLALCFGGHFKTHRFIETRTLCDWLTQTHRVSESVAFCSSLSFCIVSKH